MPRGRHRHSPPLHRLLPPSTVAGASLVTAGGAWFVAEPLVLRILVAAAAAAAVTGAVLMRGWDRTAGRRIAELNRAREADVWKAEERVADLEGDLDESRALRTRLENKLRAKRVELAGLRNEHAALLRRYATAETERATALERHRLLELEAAAAAPRELTAGAAAPTPAAYARAAAALERLASGAGRAVEVRAADRAPVERPAGAAEATDRTQAGPGANSGASTGTSTGAEALAPVPAPAGAAKPPVPRGPAPVQPPRAPVPTRELREHLRPSGVLAPYAPQNLPAVRKQGGFDFFGTGKGAGTTTERAVQETDLADVVGEEALAEHRTARDVDGDAVGEVIDLTAHDETEQLDVAGLRSVAGS